MCPGALGLAGVVLIVVGVVLGNAGMLMGLIGGIGLLAVAAYLLIRGRAASPDAPNPLVASLRQQSAAAETAESTARNLLVEAALPLHLAGDLTAAALAGAEARLDSAQAALSHWREARERAEEAQRQLRAQEQRVGSATLLLQNASEAQGEALREWQGWLEQKGLPVGFAPETVVEFMGRVETARVKREMTLGARRRVEAIEHDIEQFREQVEPLALRHGLPLNSEDRLQLASVADVLIRRLEAIPDGILQPGTGRGAV